jgi:glutamate/aspartate transport system substrate-binding protein
MHGLLKNIARGVSVVALSIPAVHAMDVRTAAQDSQPKFIKEGSVLTGLCIDIFKALERTDADLKFPPLTSFTPLPRTESQLLDGSLDVICGLASTKERKEKFDVIDIPVYTTHLTLAARNDDAADVKGFDDIRKLGPDAIVLTVTQTVQAEMASAQAGLKVDSAAKDTSQNLQKLVAGRGRFILHNDFALVDEIKRDNVGDKVKLLPVQLTTEGRFFIVSKKAPAGLKDKLTAALDKLSKSGELAKIFQPYKPK